jgi:hypothetical protein
MIFGVVRKVVRLSHGQVWANRHISLGPKGMSNPTDP